MTVPSTEMNRPTEQRREADRLDSWKDIAAYLHRDVSTVQRWERQEGLPVRRHFHRRLGSVYAYRTEIDKWWQCRTSGNAAASRHSANAASDGSDADSLRAFVVRAWRMPATIATLGLVLAVVVARRPAGTPPLAPEAEISPLARQEYTIGRYHLSKQTEADISRAIDHFGQAARIDPTYATANAALSDAWWARGIWGARTLNQVETESRAALQKALASSPDSAPARVSLGRIRYTYERDWAGAEADFRRALALDPDNLDAHYFYAMLLMGLGRFPESIAHIDRAAQLDPRSSMIQSGYGRILYRARRYDDAIGRLNRATVLEPRNAGAFYRLGDVYVALGRYGDAFAAYDRARSTGLSDSAHALGRSRVFARMGHEQEARRLLAELEAGPGAPPVPAAQIYAALGDHERAFHLLFRVVEESSQSPLLLFVNVDPPFDALRADARWKTLLARLNLAASDNPD